MKVSFEKSDRLIELLDDSYQALEGYHYSRAHQMKNSANSRIQELYSKLVEITRDEKSEKEKHSLRIQAYAQAYDHKSDVIFGERALRGDFDEVKVVRMLTNAYWQIQTWQKIEDESGNNFSDKEGFLKVINKWYPDENHKDILIDVISKQEPTIEDIEKEFWENCPDTSKINDWCNIYRERFKSHLLKITEDFELDTLLFDKNSIYHQYLHDLRETGLLKVKEGEVEARLMHIAFNINRVSNQVVELFKGFRAMTKETVVMDSSAPIFSNVYQSKVDTLKTIYKKSNLVLKCSEADFLYWFGGVGEKGDRIKWIKKKGRNPNKSALYQYCLKLNQDTTPAMINQVFDIDIKSNNNTANDESFIDIKEIFKNL